MKIVGVGFAVFAATLIFSSTVVVAKPEYYQKESVVEGVTCRTCHTSVPKRGAEDKQLNEVGRFYEQNKRLPNDKDSKK